MKLPLMSDGQQLNIVRTFVKLPLNLNRQQLNIVRLAHASSLGSWGGRKRRGYSKRAGALVKGMEQQLYDSKGETPELRDANFQDVVKLFSSRDPSIHRSHHPSMNGIYLIYKFTQCVRACVCPMRQFYVLIDRQNQFCHRKCRGRFFL